MIIAFTFRVGFVWFDRQHAKSVEAFIYNFEH